MKQPCVYILASREYGTLYIGVTSDLIARLWQHRSREVKGFTSTYRVFRLVRFEQFETMHEAIAREKQLKRWRRQWKSTWSRVRTLNGSTWRQASAFRRFRHAELASASIVETYTALSRKWTLKQVQGDGSR